MHRRERLTGDVGRAVVGATTTAHADIQLEQLLHREVLKLRDAEVLLLLNVLDHLELARRGGALEEGVGRRKDEVVELGVPKQRDPRQRADHVDPPEGRVDVERSGNLDPGEHQRHDVTDRRPVGPFRVYVDLGRVDAQPLNQEARDQQRAEPTQDQPVLPGRQPGGARSNPAVRNRHSDADDANQPEDVRHQRVTEVARSDQDVDRDVVVDREQRGDEEQHDHRGHDAEVHHARVRVAQHPLRAATALDQPAQADRKVVKRAAQGVAGNLPTDDRFAQPPDARASHQAVNDDPDHEREQHVEHPEMIDIEE